MPLYICDSACRDATLKTCDLSAPANNWRMASKKRKIYKKHTQWEFGRFY